MLLNVFMRKGQMPKITAKFLQGVGCDLWHAEKNEFLFYFILSDEDAAFVQKNEKNKSYFAFVVLHLIACGNGGTQLRKTVTIR